MGKGIRMHTDKHFSPYPGFIYRECTAFPGKIYGFPLYGEEAIDLEYVRYSELNACSKDYTSINGWEKFLSNIYGKVSLEFIFLFIDPSQFGWHNYIFGFRRL